MSDASLALQGAIVARLRADSGVQGIAAPNKDTKGVYDAVPRDNSGKSTAPFPYVSLGEDQVIAVLADCYAGADHSITIHVWSREPGYPQAKRLGNAVIDALHEAELSVTGSNLILLEFESAQYLRDPDGLTSHGVLTFSALTEPTD